MSVVLWALSTVPGGDIEHSYLAAAGRFLAPTGAPLGLNWQMMAALLTDFVRKENTIATSYTDPIPQLSSWPMTLGRAEGILLNSWEGIRTDNPAWA